jgi:uncharacterized membrane protein YphA (DoxX/SURF4 family)
MNFFKSRVFRLILSLVVAGILYLIWPPCFPKLTLLIVLAILLVIINLDKYIGKVRILTHLTRLAVGGLFIFSGFIKANDPAGFSYKLNEYFEVFGHGFSCEMKVAPEGGKACPCQPEPKAVEITVGNYDVIVPAEAYVDMNADSVINADDSSTVYSQYEDKAYQDAYAAAVAASTPKQEVHESSLKPMWEFFAEHSLLLAIIICGIEIVLGIFLLIGWQVRWTLWILLAMIVFFSFLTFYSACCNKVTSCGCFGDAIKLTPWESFWKDLILLILIALLFAGKDNIKALSKNSILMATLIGIGTFLSFAFPVYTYLHLPVIDFRPYKIGTNIYDATQYKDPATTGCVTDSVVYEFYMFQTKEDSAAGRFTMFTMDNYPDSTWTYYCRFDRKIREGNCAATILDFNVNDPETGIPVTDSVLHIPGVQFFIVMYDIELAETDAMSKVNAFYAEAAAANVPVNALVNVGAEGIAAFRTQTGAKYPFFSVDQTALKTIVRSNPGLVMLRDGVVVGMWHYNDWPTLNEAMETPDPQPAK